MRFISNQSKVGLLQVFPFDSSPIISAGVLLSVVCVVEGGIAEILGESCTLGDETVDALLISILVKGGSTC